MSDYAAQFHRSYLNPPPPGHPGNRIQPPTHNYAYNQGYPPYKSVSQPGYAPRFDYYNSPTQQYNLEVMRNTGQSRIASDIHRQWNYAVATSSGESHRRATDPLPPVPLKLQGTLNPPRYPYTLSSAQGASVKHNPTTSHAQYNPVHRSKSLAVPRAKLDTFPHPERSNTPPPNKPTGSDRGLVSWGRSGTSELDKFNLPKSLAFNKEPQKDVQKPKNGRDLTLADILVESVPVKKGNEETTLPPEHQRRRSSDDILDTSQYIHGNRPIDEYVSLTGTRKKTKSRRVSDPFTGLLPGKSLSADQLDSQYEGLQGGLRSREESIEKLRGSNNESDSAFTSRFEQQNLPSPTSSEEELRHISGLRGGVAVKRSRSLSTGPKGSSFSPRHARVKVLANNMSGSLDSTLDSKKKCYVSKYQAVSPVNTYVPKRSAKSTTSLEENLARERKEKTDKRPQPSTIDPSAIRRALIEELKSGKFSLTPAKEPQYAVVKKKRIEPKREKVSTKTAPSMTYKPGELSSLADQGIHAARTGDLEALKGFLMSEHVENPHLIDKRSAVHRSFHIFIDKATESNLIHITSESGSAGCLKWLAFFAPEGACVALNKDRFVPAILAIRKGSLECVKILVINAKVPLTIQELGNETLLHHAAYIGHTDILKWLLDYMKERQGNVIKDSDLQDAFGVTPAHFAAQQGFLDCLQVLQDAMCNLWTMDQHKQTPMDWASAAKQDLAANYLFLVRSVRYLSDQLSLQRKHSQRLQEKMALVEDSNSKLKEDYEEQINVVREEYETRKKDMQHDFLAINEKLLKEGKGGKPKRRRGVFRTFSLPAKQGQKKPVLQREANFSTEESSPDEPRLNTKLFPHTSDPDLTKTAPKEPTIEIELPSARVNEEMLSTIEEVSSIAHRDSVIQPSEEISPHKIGTIQEITIAENTDVQDRDITPVVGVNSEISPSLQEVKGEAKSAYRSSPDPFTTGSSHTTPDNTLQRKKRTFFWSKTPSKTSLKEDSISKKSADGSISSRVGETTSCHDQVVSTLKRVFSNSSRHERTQASPVTTSIQHTTQSDQVTLQTVQLPLSPNLIEKDFILESEYSSHASLSEPVPHRAAPDPPSSDPKYGCKASYVHATAAQDSIQHFANSYPRTRANYQQFANDPYYRNMKPAVYNPSQYTHNQPVQYGKRQSCPGVTPPGSLGKLNRLEPYSRQAEKLLDSGYLGQSSDSLDAIRQRPKQLATNTVATNRATQAYSAPNPQGYFSLPSTPQRLGTHRNVSWPNTTYSPQRAATMHVHNQYQQTQYSMPRYATKKSTKISDL